MSSGEQCHLCAQILQPLHGVITQLFSNWRQRIFVLFAANSLAAAQLFYQ